MKPERAFTPERQLAAHCPELLREGPAPDELLPLLGVGADGMCVPLTLMWLLRAAE